eukprot:Skav226734  [mRNA]  locus=scaffold720:308032:309462:- [translate_table: standard]
MRPDRFSCESGIHILSFCNALILAFTVVFDPSLDHFDVDGSERGASLWLLWQALSNSVQMFIINLKLKKLFWLRYAKCCDVLLCVTFLANVAGCGVYIAKASGDFQLNQTNGVTLGSLLIVLLSLTIVIVILETLGLWFAARKAVTMQDWEDIRWTVVSLRINSFLSLLGPLMTIFLIAYTYLVHPLDGLYTTMDFGFQIANLLVVNGLVGPTDCHKPEEGLARMSEILGFGLAISKRSRRVTFRGSTGAGSRNCIVSFPGKYPNLWEEVTDQMVCSVACVFLPSKASGLGVHAKADSEINDGECWCRQLYGPIPKEQYLRVVDLTTTSREELAFQKADAEAMGLHLVIKHKGTNNVEWEAQKSHGLLKAEQLCKLHHGRAPWGCEWFARWKENIDMAVDQKQTLHVFYFQGQKGRGKLSWDELGNEDARALKSGGLGASQKAEVAYLDKLGLPYKEHDVGEFDNFFEEVGTKVSL